MKKDTKKSSNQSLMHSDLLRMAMLFPPKSDTESQDTSAQKTMETQAPKKDRTIEVTFLKKLKKM